MSIDERALEPYGWGPFFQEAWRTRPSEEGEEPARVSAEYRGGYVLSTAHGELKAGVTGKLRQAIRKGDSPRPTVGDWVAAVARPQEGSALIQALLPRRTQLVRKAAGRQDEEQVVASNIDIVFLVSALTRVLNLRRLERYLALAWSSGAQPVIILTKADLSEDPAAARESVATLAPDVPIHTLSNVTGEGLEALQPYLGEHRTVALIGSSGVGKSTLINRLLGSARQAVAEVREDDTGRHTTTHRELFLLPQGGLLLDTPGMRELGLLESDEGLRTTFTDLEALALSCRFGDCRHETEPGCAVQESLRDGRLAPERLESYRKLVRETARKDFTREAPPPSRVRAPKKRG
jgi:ribosome biogenesis GTPase / thiamine phosphate phosphatase